MNCIFCLSIYMRKQRAKGIQYISEEELGWGGSGDLPSTGIKN